MKSKDSLLHEDWAQLTVQISPDVVFQDLDGETVLLEMKSGYYYGLDEVSTEIWKQLSQGERLSNILEAMLDAYKVNEKQCRQDIMHFLLDLEQKKLITLSRIAQGAD